MMKAAVLAKPADIASLPLRVTTVPKPAAKPGYLLLRVRACGVWPTS